MNAEAILMNKAGILNSVILAVEAVLRATYPNTVLRTKFSIDCLLLFKLVLRQLLADIDEVVVVHHRLMPGLLHQCYANAIQHFTMIINGIAPY